MPGLHSPLAVPLFGEPSCQPAWDATARPPFALRALQRSLVRLSLQLAPVRRYGWPCSSVKHSPEEAQASSLSLGNPMQLMDLSGSLGRCLQPSGAAAPPQGANKCASLLCPATCRPPCAPATLTQPDLSARAGQQGRAQAQKPHPNHQRSHVLAGISTRPVLRCLQTPEYLHSAGAALPANP